MTRDPRIDPNSDPLDPVDPVDETRVVERETYVERPMPASATPVAPAAPASQVNVNSEGYAEAAGPGPLSFIGRILSLLFGILAVLIGLRILLLLLVANESNAIVDFVYNVTEPFVAPFRGIFAFDQVTPGGGSVFDIAAVVAFVGWLLIYLLLMAILSLADRDRTTV